MPLSVASVLSFIPTQIWKPLKKFVTKDGTIVFDIAFKLSTKYTPGLLIVMLCLSFANQFVRNVEMDCSTNKEIGDNGPTDTELTDFCWNYEVFLVVKALCPNMSGRVTYPGVSGYNKDVDEVIVQRYYKYLWLGIGILIGIALLPYFCWKFIATKKIRPLIEMPLMSDLTVTVEEVRVAYYLKTTGFNGSFGWQYTLCKLFATVTPVIQWWFLCGFLGKRYQYYGVDALNNFMDSSAQWPNPMDALFPKMAKCDRNRHGFGGDMETKSAQCQLPMNNLTQWSFFIYWWWTTIIFVINILSLCKLFIFLIPYVRKYNYRKFVNAACRGDVENCARTNGPKYMKSKKKDVIYVNLSFGDWLVLNFIKKNLPDGQFRNFIRKLVTTENFVLQLTEIPILPSCPPMEETKKGVNYGWHFDSVDGCGGNHKPPEGALANTSSGSSDSPHCSMLPKFSLNISKPVDIDSILLNKKTNETEALADNE